MIVTIAMRQNISTAQVSARSFRANPLMYNLRALNMTLLTPLNNTMRKFIKITSHYHDERSINSFRVLLAIHFRCFRTPRRRTFRAFRALIRVNHLMYNQSFRQELANVISRRVSVASFQSYNGEILRRQFIKGVTRGDSMFINDGDLQRLHLTYTVGVGADGRPSFNSRLSDRLMSRSGHKANSSDSFLSIYNARRTSLTTYTFACARRRGAYSARRVSQLAGCIKAFM